MLEKYASAQMQSVFSKTPQGHKLEIRAVEGILLEITAQVVSFEDQVCVFKALGGYRTTVTCTVIPPMAAEE